MSHKRNIWDATAQTRMDISLQMSNESLQEDTQLLQRRSNINFIVQWLYRRFTHAATLKMVLFLSGTGLEDDTAIPSISSSSSYNHSYNSISIISSFPDHIIPTPAYRVNSPSTKRASVRA